MATPPQVSPARHHPGSLTEWLRHRSDAQLATLLRRRPDLALPAPADLAALASRVSVRTSVQRAIDGLDAFTLRALEVLVLTAPPEAPTRVDRAAAEAWLGPAAAGLDRAVTELLALALLWDDHDQLHLVATVRDALGSYPAGLGRPAAELLQHASAAQLAPVLASLGLPAAPQPAAAAAIAAVLGDPDRVAALVADTDAAEREVLTRLAAGPPLGRVPSARPPTPQATTPPQRLLARGLLVAVDSQTVELPREVAVAVREAPAGVVAAQEPPIAVTEHPPAHLDRLGTTAVLDALRLVDALGAGWTAHPPAVLRSGGVGVRDLRRTARDLDVTETLAALVIEVAAAAGLLAPTTGLDPVYLPTPDFDSWRGRDTAERWTDLASAWLAMTRQPGLVNDRGERDRLITALGPDAERGAAPAVRAEVLDLLLTLPPGTSPARRGDVLERLAWRAPRRAAAAQPAVTAVLAEADLLGVTAAGGLTGYSRTLLDGSPAAAQGALTAALPEPVDHVVLQPDLTVVVPGPPTAQLAGELALTADLESTGGAHVYRITEASVRRALDAGRTAAELSALVTARSRTPVPQALSYLIEDVARRHGVLRAGSASAYLRCEDEALLASVLADRATSTVQLRRIAPGVLVSPAPVSRVLDVLRAAGYAPAAETPDGAVLTLDAETPRAPARAAVRSLRARAALDSQAQLADLVRRIRDGDAQTELTVQVPPLVQQIPGVTSAATMALLRQAIREGRRVLLGHAEPDGTATRHTILPISLAGGFVRGHEPSSHRLRSFQLYRLTTVRLLADEDAGADGDVGADPA